MSYTFPSLLPATVIPHFLAGEKIPLESVLFPCGVHYNNWTIPVLLGVLSVPETHHDGNRKKKELENSTCDSVLGVCPVTDHTDLYKGLCLFIGFC
jgi:hypothetical protein